MAMSVPKSGYARFMKEGAMVFNVFEIFKFFYHLAFQRNGRSGFSKYWSLYGISFANTFFIWT